MYYPCSENKGADQLCSYCTADLCLCFSHIHNVGLSHDSAQFFYFVRYLCYLCRLFQYCNSISKQYSDVSRDY